MTERTDEEIVRHCRAGDHGAFDQLVTRHQKTIFNMALRMVRDPDDAADVTQSVFVKVYENLDGFNERYKFFSWLYKIAVHESLNMLQHKKRFEGLTGVEIGEEAEEGKDDASVEQERRIQDGLMMLKVEHRTVVVLKHMQGLSYEEIGRILDLPEKTVKSRLFTARQVLKEFLTKKGQS
jgi:RNA polymerase sigma-70 factor (ECF subfamily)